MSGAADPGAGGGASAPLLIACDFDGTVTQRDTLRLLAAEYGSDTLWSALRERIRARELTLDEALERLFLGMSVSFAEARALVLARNPVRPGFAALVGWSRARGHRLLIVSDGFRCMIDAVLEGTGLGDLEVVANDARFSPSGCRILWREREPCPTCGGRCKRGDLLVRAAGCARVVYVGGGISDRCAALAADLVFARGDLADHLAGRAVPFAPFDDFHEVLRGLPRGAAPA